MKEKNLYTIKEAINQMLETYKLDGRVKEIKLINSWEKLMGAVISNHTTDIKIIKNSFYVTVNSSALRNELFYAREKIKQMLNNEIGEEYIQEVVLK